MALMQKLPEITAGDSADELDARYGKLAPELILELVIKRHFAGQIAAVSSFGGGSAVLLHMIAQIDRSLPVIFLDTGKHFPETAAYREHLIERLDLKNASLLTPDPATLAADDDNGTLHRTDSDRCCAIRKVEPMARAVEPWKAWITGRKRFQSDARSKLPVFEAVGERVRINPLASWQARDMAAYAQAHDLPPHPLSAYGYLSIGCLPCTRPAPAGGDERSGRWAGQDKTECGIHLSGLEQSLTSSGL